MVRKGEVILICLLTAVFLASVSMAAKGGYPANGSTVEFTKQYPMVVLALVTILISIVGYFLWQRDQDIKKQLLEASDNFKEANKSLKEATTKIDATINTLFERDRDIEHDLSTLHAAVASIQATCSARGKMCPLHQSSLVCLDRRDGNDRRQEEGHGKDPP